MLSNWHSGLNDLAFTAWIGCYILQQYCPLSKTLSEYERILPSAKTSIKVWLQQIANHHCMVYAVFISAFCCILPFTDGCRLLSCRLLVMICCKHDVDDCSIERYNAVVMFYYCTSLSQISFYHQQRVTLLTSWVSRAQ